MKYALLIIFLFISFFAAAQFKEKDITAPLPKKMRSFILVDVRTAEEFNEGHLPTAQNIDWLSADFSKAFKGVRKRKKIYLYCRSGKRSVQAAAHLDSLGFKKVVNLLGGYNAFKEASIK